MILVMRRPLEINLLRTFVMLVEEQSVTRVARRLNRTQPAISLQLRPAEEAAGHPIVRPRSAPSETDPARRNAAALCAADAEAA